MEGQIDSFRSRAEDTNVRFGSKVDLLSEDVRARPLT